MTLKEIGEALEISQRTLRYVMEQNLVPGLANINQGRGSLRTFNARQAAQVALVAILHELGYRGPVVQTLLKVAKKQLRAKETLLSITFKITKDKFSQTCCVGIPLGKSFYERLT